MTDARIDLAEARRQAARRRHVLQRAACTTFAITANGGVRGITCLCCGKTSWNANDVEQRYCGFCHEYHQEGDQHSIINPQPST